MKKYYFGENELLYAVDENGKELIFSFEIMNFHPASRGIPFEASEVGEKEVKKYIEYVKTHSLEDASKVTPYDFI